MASRWKTNKTPPFLMIEKAMLRSQEWRSLSSKAVQVYVLIAEKFNGNNASDLSLTYAEVKDRMAPGTFAKALKELIEKEIIIVIRPGGLERRCTIFSINNKWFSKTRIRK